MGKTIIQTIGPLYGEVVNGTVFGRPNGSIFVPLVNTISISLPETNRYIRNNNNAYDDYYVVCSSAGSIPWSANNVRAVAESQDSQNYIELQISTSADFETYTSRIQTAGWFNTGSAFVSGPADLADIVADETYYLRGALMSANGVMVAVSDVIELTGVVIS